MRPHLLLPLLILLTTPTAHAHKLKLFAAVSGKTIAGYAYAADGTRLKEMTIQVWAPPETNVSTLKTNDKGEFSYVPQTRCDHRLVLWMEDGHGAEFLIKSGELAPDLPAAQTPNPGGDIRQLAQQILALRQQVDRLEEKKGLQDLIGGVGYLLGIAGIAFYLKARGR